ncbi:DUF1062 domain-containing protein [Bacteroides uniformis]|jgi:hypothetical protein|uniref:DUF1062 domain-containing protein n=1 Tax=Bacteroides uniformis TaxID=820 RepID=A0A3E5F0V6_BACUN|nr:DUF1062 domain-containing protein [Bacteroides uniformis]RGN94898.1 DUF1062 domain-containing protein [Bacteroides uniformis]
MTRKQPLTQQTCFLFRNSRKNNVEPDYSSVAYEIQHDNISIDKLLNSNQELTTFKIQTPFEFGLKFSSVIRQCLWLSASLLDRTIEAKVITTSGNYPIKKHKVRNGDTVKESFRTYSKQE